MVSTRPHIEVRIAAAQAYRATPPWRPAASLPVGQTQCRGVAVRVAVHQPAPDRTQAVWLDSAPDLSCTNSTRAHWVDVEHQATDLAVGVRILTGDSASGDLLVQDGFRSQEHLLAGAAKDDGAQT
jgi:hypothetical protein